MKKQYTRYTPVGYNTGKIIIGICYLPKPKQMTSNEYLIQGIVRGHGLPREQMLKDIWLKLKSICIKKPVTLQG